MRTKGSGADTFKYLCRKVAFIIFCCLWRRLSLLCKKAFAMVIFLSQNLVQFFSLELLIIYLKTFPLKVGGGVRWVRVRMQWGSRSKHTFAYDGEGLVKFLPS